MNKARRNSFIILLIAAGACLIAAGIIADGSRKNHDPSAIVSPVPETVNTSASEIEPAPTEEIKEDDPESVDGNAGIEIPAADKMENDNMTAEQPKEEIAEDSPDVPADPEQPKEEMLHDGGNEAAKDSPDLPAHPERQKEETPDDGGNEDAKDSPDVPADLEQPKEEASDDGGNEDAEDILDVPEYHEKNVNGDIELPEIH